MKRGLNRENSLNFLNVKSNTDSDHSDAYPKRQQISCSSNSSSSNNNNTSTANANANSIGNNSSGDIIEVIDGLKARIHQLLSETNHLMCENKKLKTQLKKV